MRSNLALFAGLLLALTSLSCSDGGVSPGSKGATGTTKVGPGTPSVLIVTLDTTRADRLSCYGYRKKTSPRIDGLAEGGVLFGNAISSAAVTPVSHASIFTGRFPYRHGLRVLHGSSYNRLPDHQVTLAEVLKEAGFRTAAFLSAFPCGTSFGLHQGFDTFDEEFERVSRNQIVTVGGGVSTGINQRRADETTDAALKWLEDPGDGPFCLWLHYFDPHDHQILPPRSFQDQFPKVRGSGQDVLRAIYDAEIEYMDLQIGRVFDALESSGRLENTVVVVVSDHGEGLGDHDWWTHGILYQEQIRVPFVLRAPGRARSTVDHLVRTVDIMPTILELVGVDIVDDMDGQSLVPLLAGNADDPGLTAYADSINRLTYTVVPGLQDEKHDVLFAVTAGGWKYIHHFYEEDKSELYDLTADPRELTNLYRRRPDQVERLLLDLRARRAVPPPDHEQGEIAPEVLERLRSLGYTK